MHNPLGVAPALCALHLRRHPKVPQLHVAVLRNEDVAGLDVTVDARLRKRQTAGRELLVGGRAMVQEAEQVGTACVCGRL